jgi:hypothetical protein
MKIHRSLAVAVVLAAIGVTSQPAGAMPGDPVAGAKVTVTAWNGAAVNVQTNDFGLAQFPDLKAGKYRIRISTQGIRPSPAPAAASPSATARKALSVQIFVATRQVKSDAIRLPTSTPYSSMVEFDAQYPQTMRVLLSFTAPVR